MPVQRAARSQPVLWIIAVLLAAIAGGLWTRPGDSLLPAAFAQTPPLAGARGVYAFTGPLDSSRYGLFMLDVDQGTIWCYEMENVGGARKLKLVAARTWVYDRYLQDFNSAEPDFRTVQKLVAQQRQLPGRVNGASQADGSEPDAAQPDTPRPDGSRVDVP